MEFGCDGDPMKKLVAQINTTLASNFTQARESIKPRPAKRVVQSREERDSNRRIKKQRMERRRRACISDKMNALHNLAVSLVGQDPEKFRRVEKADILTNCLGVLQGLYEVVQQQPELKAEMQKIGSKLASQPPEGQGNKGESRRPPAPPQPAGKENHPVNFPPTGPVPHLPPPPPRPYKPHFRASAHSAFSPVCSDVATPTLKATAHTLCDSGYHTGSTVTTPVTGSSTPSCSSSVALSPGMSIPPLRQIWPPQTSGLPFSPTTSAFVDAEFTSTPVRPAVGGRSYSPRPAQRKTDDEDTSTDRPSKVVWRPYLN
ncbi:Transcription factor [Sparganum proliferum]